MKMRNLSELFRHSCITRMSQPEIGIWTGPHYWLYDNDWTMDPNHPDIFKAGTDTIQKYMAELEELHGWCNLDTAETTAPITMMQWADGVWVVINPQNGKIHKVQFVGTYGEGFYVKDEGTTERELVIKRNGEAWTHLKVRGKDIINCQVATVCGHVFTEWYSLNIRPDGNLKYQFEFEETPHLNKEL